MDPRHLQRFHKEARAAACIHRANIVPVYFIACERSAHCYAMQFIEGQSLSAWIAQLRRAEKSAGDAEADQTTAQPRSGADREAARLTLRVAADVTPRPAKWTRGGDYFRRVAEWGVQAAEALDDAHQCLMPPSGENFGTVGKLADERTGEPLTLSVGRRSK